MLLATCCGVDLAFTNMLNRFTLFGYIPHKAERHWETNISIQSYQLLKTTKVITNTWNYTMNIYFDLSLRGIRFQILDKMSLFDKRLSFFPMR